MTPAVNLARPSLNIRLLQVKHDVILILRIDRVDHSREELLFTRNHGASINISVKVCACVSICKAISLSLIFETEHHF